MHIRKIQYDQIFIYKLNFTQTPLLTINKDADLVNI